jgi:hypothetical protein
LTILVAALLLGFNRLTNPVHITGHLKRNPKDTSAYGQGFTVIIKGSNKVLAHTFADRQGNFKVTITPAQEKSFDFFICSVAVDTMLISSFKAFDSDTPEMTFYIPALRKKNFLGQMLCPKCNKANKVYKIEYGDGIPMGTQIISETGDTTYSTIVNGHYYAGTCVVNMATYYCDRDKVKF